MVLYGCITKVGIQNALKLIFGLGGNAFAYGAVGKAAHSEITVDVSGLGQEFTSADNVNYSRVTGSNFVCTPDAAIINRMKTEITFNTTNINPAPSSAVTITEVGIFERSDIGQGIPWIIFQVADTGKDNTKSIKFTIYSTINPVRVEQ
jgi:hypothetical protein